MPIMATSVARAVSFSILTAPKKRPSLDRRRDLLGIEKRGFHKTKFFRADASPLRERRRMRARSKSTGNTGNAALAQEARPARESGKSRGNEAKKQALFRAIDPFRKRQKNRRGKQILILD